MNGSETLMRRLDSDAPGFEDALSALLTVGEDDQLEIRETVDRIIRDVRTRGDAALVELTNRFDGKSVDHVNELAIEPARLQQAYDSIDPLVREALDEAAARVREYHEKQLAALGAGEHWQYSDQYGNELGQRINPMARVGLYAPGGKAAYPSTILMTAIPARVAGVQEVVLCVPTPRGELNETLLAAAWLCDIDRVFTIGGAQAIAAMAYGTETLPRVDKIVGPGNVYVATAKELVFGDVGIDMIAGPSEVVVVADASADPDWLILDLFAQAEHDEMAQSILISDDSAVLDQVEQRLPELLSTQPRKEIINTALESRGALIKADDMQAVYEIVNRIAPEHLQLALTDPASHLTHIRHAGAIFLGANTAEVVGDYTAGPSHVLPTSGTARFASPLGVYDFQTRTSVIQCSDEGSIRLNRAAAILAKEEGLMAHAGSAESRVKG